MNLNLEQQQAAFTDAKNALVIAGAGSGKTRVLTARVEHLIENCKVSPFEIMCFTFTRAGANEMKERLKATIGGDAHKLHIGTMHSLALTYIRRFGEALGIRPATVTVYNEWESEFLLKEIARDIGVFNGKAWKIPKKEIDAMFSRYYSAGTEPEESEPGYNLFQAFFQRCRENNALTYGGLILGFYMIIPELKKRLHIRHILVDEVQDIDRLQHLIISMLQMNFDASVFMVGDLSQSIFSWRGAVPEYLMELEKNFFVYKLANNYRSVEEIVRSANKMIRNNIVRIPLDMEPTREGNGVNVIKFADSEFIVRKYLCPIESGVAVLARNHVLLKKIASLLDESGTEYRYVGRKSEMIHSEDFRRFVAFLKLEINEHDNFSFLLIKEILGLDRAAYAAVRQMAAELGISHFAAWYSMAPDVGWVQFFWESYPSFDDYLEALSDKIQCPNFVAFAAASGCPTVKAFLDWITTYDISEEATEEFNGLKLMTIHAAKGLEWPTVILAGCNEGLIPSKQAIGAGTIEEERRLFYVAMTRARDHLVLTVRPERKEAENGRVYESPISRFVGEAVA